MARAPKPIDLGIATISPRLSPSQIPQGLASVEASGTRAIGAALQDVGNAFEQITSRISTAADAQNDARFEIEWLKSSNEIYRDVEQKAGEDGTGYETVATRLEEKYKELDEKYPVSGEKRRLARELGVARDTVQYGQKAALAKQKRAYDYYTGIEQKEIQGVLQEIEKDPSDATYSRLQASIERLVESGKGVYYTEGQASQRQREVLGLLTASRLNALIEKDPEAASKLIDQLQKAKRVVDRAPPEQATFDFFTDRVPTASERRKIFQQGGVVVNLDTNWAKGNRQTSPMVVIPDNATPQQREAAQAYATRIAELYEQRFGKSLKPRVVTRSENKGPDGKPRGRDGTIHTEPFAVTDSRAVQFFSSDEGRAMHAQILRETLGAIPGVRFSIPHNPSKGDKGAHGSGTNEVELARSLIQELQRSRAAQPNQDLPPDRLLTDIVDKATLDRIAKATGIPAKDLTVKDAVKVGYALAADRDTALADEDRAMLDEAERGVGMTVEEGASRILGLGDVPMGRLEEGQSFQADVEDVGQFTFTARELNAIEPDTMKAMVKIARERNATWQKQSESMARDMMERQLATVETQGSSIPGFDAKFLQKVFRDKPETLRRFNSRLEVAKSIHGITGGMADLDREAIEDRMIELEDRIYIGGETDPELLKAYGRAKTRVDRHLRDRERDPASAVADSKEVKAALETMPGNRPTTPAEAFALVDARLKAQARLDIRPTPITKYEANRIIRDVINAPRRERRDVARETYAKMRAIYGSHAPSVMEAAIRLSSDDTEDDARLLTSAQRRHERELEKKLPGRSGAPSDPTPDEIKRAMDGKPLQKGDLEQPLFPRSGHNPYMTQ